MLPPPEDWTRQPIRPPSPTARASPYRHPDGGGVNTIANRRHVRGAPAGRRHHRRRAASAHDAGRPTPTGSSAPRPRRQMDADPAAGGGARAPAHARRASPATRWPARPAPPTSAQDNGSYDDDARASQPLQRLVRRLPPGREPAAHDHSCRSTSRRATTTAARWRRRCSPTSPTRRCASSQIPPSHDRRRLPAAGRQGRAEAGGRSHARRHSLAERHARRSAGASTSSGAGDGRGAGGDHATTPAPVGAGDAVLLPAGRARRRPRLRRGRRRQRAPRRCSSSGRSTVAVAAGRRGRRPRRRWRRWRPRSTAIRRRPRPSSASPARTARRHHPPARRRASSTPAGRPA